MNEQEALVFIQRILTMAPTVQQAGMMLSQMYSIIDPRRKENPDLNRVLSYIQTALQSIPESREIALKGASLTAEDLKIARERAHEREIREMQQTRC